MKVELLGEPYIEFGNQFLFSDPKQGIKTGGFFSITNSTHRSEIHFGVIGTNQNIEDLIEWVDQFKNSIQPTANVQKQRKATTIEDGIVEDILFDDSEFEVSEQESETIINQKLNPTFPGFNKDTCFRSELVNTSVNNISIRKTEIEKILKGSQTKTDKADALITLYRLAFKQLLDESISRPDVCFIIVPTKIFDLLGSIRIGNTFINFRRKLKATLLAENSVIPVQIILEDTIRGTKKELQDSSMIAWNFVVAQYYKVNGIPWSLTDIDTDTCFIGISFHRVINSEKNEMRSSVAQAFNKNGRGLIFVGKQFLWDERNIGERAPHLTHDYAKDLISKVLQRYIRQNEGVPPKRVVIHKTTDFWNSYIHKDYCEVEGLKAGIKEELGDTTEVDLVTIKSAEEKLLRVQGKYPVMRGTLLRIDDEEGILYTTGYVPYLETFPGMATPHPISISIYEGESTLKKVCSEILALTKMNFNNCGFYDSLPITLIFSRKVGEIIQYLPEGVEPPDKYYFYM